MAAKSVLKMGDPRLLQVSREVETGDANLLEGLITDMRDTMAAENGAGLAAPQIGVMMRVVIFGCAFNPRYPDAPEIEETVLINPVVTPIGEARVDDWEGCLSLPGLRARVPRYESIRYQGVDAKFNPIDRRVSDFHARVVQHECDHLDGILYPFRIDDMRYFGFSDTLTEQGILDSQPCDDDPG